MPNALHWRSPRRLRGSVIDRIQSPDNIWDEPARHYDEPALAALILHIALTNVWNRLNVTTRQVAGEWLKSAEAKEWVESSSASG
jgi:hypothetical protein